MGQVCILFELIYNLTVHSLLNMKDWAELDVIFLDKYVMSALNK